MTTDTPVTPDQSAPPARRRWWQRLPFLVLVGVLPLPFGMFFLGFIAIALLLSDMTRESEVRAGGGVLLLWWAYSFREGETSPYLGVAMLAVAAVLLARGWRRRVTSGEPAGSPWAPLGGAALAAALGVVVLVPYGYKAPELTREDAARRVFAERAARPWKVAKATDYLVDPGRLRVIHKPVWYVAVYERNPAVPRTQDGQPCFAKREVWRVDALDGTLRKATFDEASVGGDPCLPIKLGTEKDLAPAPPS
ncbi:MAG TPA: hypothetical protein VGW75_01370 [Solirubrobacteraceae bacterium]|nr:hypothetical protein [Solirubrobacteraceae bacterium]